MRSKLKGTQKLLKMGGGGCGVCVRGEDITHSLLIVHKVCHVSLTVSHRMMANHWEFLSLVHVVMNQSVCQLVALHPS